MCVMDELNTLSTKQWVCDAFLTLLLRTCNCVQFVTEIKVCPQSKICAKVQPQRDDCCTQSLYQVRAGFHGFPGGPAPGGVQFMALEVQLLSMEAGSLNRRWC